jgi:CrcB protein
VQWLWLFVAGGLGAVARTLLAGAIQVRTGDGFPFGTLTVNVLGCLAIGMLATLAEEHSGLPDSVRLPLVVGFLGGFTTFSAFGLETWQLASDGAAAMALTNAAVSVVARRSRRSPIPPGARFSRAWGAARPR